MGLFKSDSQRKAEQDLEVRKGLKKMKRQIRNLEKDEKGFIHKAKKARQLGDKTQLNFLRSNLKRTAGTRRMMERQILNMETFNQLRNQAEVQAEFAQNLNMIAQIMSGSVNSIDFAQIQKNCETAINKYEMMEQTMEMMMETQTESIGSIEVGEVDDIISDTEIDRMLDDQIVAEENKEIEDSVKNRLERMKERVSKIQEKN